LSEYSVVIVGGGAAGIGAARRLHDAGVDCLIVEARERLGGRAWTVATDSGIPIDLGCGWLHSAERNPWREIAERQGRAIDKSPPPWMRRWIPADVPVAEQEAFSDALMAFYARLDAYSEDQPDVPAATFLEPGNRWNGLIDAVSTYVNGAELDRVSVIDFDRYDDSGTNWRVVEGYGTAIVAHAEGLPVKLGCPVTRIDHSGKRLTIETGEGTLTADAAIVTVSSNLIAAEAIAFTPTLPEKAEAAAGLPLGRNDKLFFALENAEEFESDRRLFGQIDRAGTAAYHFGPFGRPIIEAYFGGSLAAELEANGGEPAFVDFATEELKTRLGSAFARRITPLRIHCWGNDPYALGSYSHALPGKAECRAVLAAPVEDRLFFAGEACSRHDYSTAHGAYLTGCAAAEQTIAAIKPSHSSVSHARASSTARSE
jgi:monoamine oxidase